MIKVKFNVGFTLIEILAAVAVLGVVGTVMIGIIFSSLRGANKSDAQIALAQNGSIALSQISRIIRGGAGVGVGTTCSVDAEELIPLSAIDIRTLEGDTVSLSCLDIPDGTIASNGASLIDDTIVAATACSFSCIQADEFTKPVITASFTLKKKNASNLVENNEQQSFQTTVSVRNIR
ncbi:MAG: type II secretion system protein [Candidatus Levybacteria bacterium]|nr:type II secretion system protein [Candidatus Levybacteria bacterium]